MSYQRFNTVVVNGDRPLMTQLTKDHEVLAPAWIPPQEGGIASIIITYDDGSTVIFTEE